MGSAAFTVVCGYAHLWFGGQFDTPPGESATRVIQGIITGIGFLGGGVIYTREARRSLLDIPDDAMRHTVPLSEDYVARFGLDAFR